MSCCVKQMRWTVCQACSLLGARHPKPGVLMISMLRLRIFGAKEIGCSAETAPYEKGTLS